jgi:hypothetical protein
MRLMAHARWIGVRYDHFGMRTVSGRGWSDALGAGVCFVTAGP